MEKINFFLKKWQKKYAAVLMLTASLAIGAYLRFHHLALRSFWLDEADGANLLNYRFGELWEKIALTANNPGYIYSLKTWSYLAGNSEFSLRFFSAIVGVLSILAIFYLGKNLYNKKIGLLAAFMLAVNYFSIFFSTQARQYSLSILFSILSLFFFWKLISAARPRLLFFYVLATTFGLYLHPWFFLILFTQTIYLLTNRMLPNRFKIWLSQGLIIILSSPWLIELLKNGKNGASAWIGTAHLSFFYETLKYFIWGSEKVFLIASLLAVFYILAGYAEKNNSKNKVGKINNSTFLLLFLLIIPLVIAFAVSIFIPFYKTGRYEAVLLPMFILLVARLWIEIENKFIVLAICLGLFLSANVSVLKDQRDIKSYSVDDRIAAHYLLDQSKNNDIFIFTGLNRPPFEYYFNKLNKAQKNVSLVSFPKEMSQHPAYQNSEKDKVIDINNEANQIIQTIKERPQQNIFLIYAPQSTGADLLVQKLNENFRKVEEIPASLLNPERKDGLISPLHFNRVIIYQP